MLPERHSNVIAVPYPAPNNNVFRFGASDTFSEGSALRGCLLSLGATREGEKRQSLSGETGLSEPVRPLLHGAYVEASRVPGRSDSDSLVSRGSDSATSVPRRITASRVALRRIASIGSRA